MLINKKDEERYSWFPSWSQNTLGMDSEVVAVFKNKSGTKVFIAVEVEQIKHRYWRFYGYKCELHRCGWGLFWSYQLEKTNLKVKEQLIPAKCFFMNCRSKQGLKVKDVVEEYKKKWG